MKEILDPLILTPGARLVALISPDGVPIAILEGRSFAQSGARDEDAYDPAEDFQAYAGLAASWLGEATRAVAPLSWSPPTRLVLGAARGTLVMLAGPGAILLMLLDKGVSAEGVRLPMDSAIARMQRHLRSLSPPRQVTSSPAAPVQQEQTANEAPVAHVAGYPLTDPAGAGMPQAPLPSGTCAPSQHDQSNQQGSTGAQQQSAGNNLSEVSGDQ